MRMPTDKEINTYTLSMTMFASFYFKMLDILLSRNVIMRTFFSFGGRRIILRQGHPPSASYFVLSGESK